MGNGVKVGIHQPNFMPWLGYFAKIHQSDVFILLDDAQFQKTGASYTNRVAVNVGGEAKQLTIPVKRPAGTTAINEAEFANPKFRGKVLNALQGAYGKAPFFKAHRALIFDLVQRPSENLAEYNVQFIEGIAKALGSSARLIRASELNVSATSTERLVQLVVAVNGTVYLSGKGGDNYQDHNQFAAASISIEYTNVPDYAYQQYRSNEFLPGLSIVDAIFSVGIETLASEFFSARSRADTRKND